MNEHDCNFCDCENNANTACKCGCHYDPDTMERYPIKLSEHPVFAAFSAQAKASIDATEALRS